MKFIKTILIFFIFLVPQISLADLSSIEKLSCEAILCLSTGGPPHECDPALNYFKSLKAKKWKDTFKKRRKFLDICPDTNSVDGLKDVLAAGAFRCDKPDLLAMLNPKFDFDGNITQTSALPSYCVNYYSHSLTRLGSLPVKMNPTGYCYDIIDCNDIPPWSKTKPTKVGVRCYKLIKKPGWMDDLGSNVECLNLWK